MINDSLVRLDELEVAYKRLQQSHHKLLADYQALGGKVDPEHSQGLVDPEDDKIKIVINPPGSGPMGITPRQFAAELLEGLSKDKEFQSCLLTAKAEMEAKEPPQ
jgi:hypothetical protein